MRWSFSGWIIFYLRNHFGKLNIVRGMERKIQFGDWSWSEMGKKDFPGEKGIRATLGAALRKLFTSSLCTVFLYSSLDARTGETSSNFDFLTRSHFMYLFQSFFLSLVIGWICVNSLNVEQKNNFAAEGKTLFLYERRRKTLSQPTVPKFVNLFRTKSVEVTGFGDHWQEISSKFACRAFQKVEQLSSPS